MNGKFENYIGVFDSGVGGISVLQELTKLSAKCSYTDFVNGAFITTAEIAVILKELIARCEAFPDAVLEVDW